MPAANQANRFAAQEAARNPYTAEGIHQIFKHHQNIGFIPKRWKTAKGFFDELKRTMPLVAKNMPEGSSPQTIVNAAAARLVQIDALSKSQSQFEKTARGTSLLEEADLVMKSRGYMGIPLKYSKGEVSFNPRAYRDSIPKPIINYLKMLSDKGILPPNAAARYVEDVEKHWYQLGKELKGQGKDRGHTNSGKYGGPRGPRAVFAEYAADNRGHGEIARMMRDKAQDLGIPWNWMEDAVEFVLNNEGLRASPVELKPAMLDAVDQVRGQNLDPNYVMALEEQRQRDAIGMQALEDANKNGSYVSTSKTINDVETNGEFVDKQELIGGNVDEVSVARERKRLMQIYDPDVDPAQFDMKHGAVRFRKLRAIAGALDDIPLAGEAAAAGLIFGGTLFATGDPAVAAETTGDAVPDLLPVIGDIAADDSSNIERLPVEGNYEFVDMNRNQILGERSMGVQKRDGEWEKVPHGEGAAGPGMGKRIDEFLSNIGGYIRFSI